MRQTRHRREKNQQRPVRDGSPAARRARSHKVRGGELPHERYSLVYGGVSRGTACRLCGKPIKRGAPEVEIMWLRSAPGRATGHLHPACPMPGSRPCDSR
jgi:hypothetical protein